MITDAIPMRLLIVEDEPGIVRYLRFELGRQDFTVLTATSGHAALDVLDREAPDVIIMDLGLPDIDGIELVTLLRDRNLTIPIIVLSSQSHERTIVEALELGADDYLTKPFGMGELVARINIARRHRVSYRHRPGREPEQPIYRAGDLAMDHAHRIVTVRGRPVHLSPRQYKLLELLVEHAGKLLTREFILREVWYRDDEMQYLRIYIRALRQIIEPDPDRPTYITTKIGVGYRIRPPDRHPDGLQG
jgi:two-component system, OmpR family, KDP operon response regulator KdpE